MLSSRFLTNTVKADFVIMSLKTEIQKLQVETDSSHKELVSPSNIKKEKDDDGEGSKRKRRKTTTEFEQPKKNDDATNSQERIDSFRRIDSQLNNDSLAQFGQQVVTNLRESDLSKGKLLALQIEILATIARYIA